MPPSEEPRNEVAQRSRDHPVRLESTRTILEIVGAVVGLICFVIAIVEYREVKSLRTQVDFLRASVKDLQSKVNDLQSSSSTRFVGPFPKNIKQVTDVVSSASDGGNLDIMVDYVGYGHYSARKDAENYRAMLEQQAPTVTIRMLVHDRCLAERMHREQFPPSKFQEEAGKERFRQFCREYNGGVSCPSYDAFTKLLFHRQESYMEELLERGINIRVTPQRLPFFVWNADHQKAVFSFPSERPEVSEISLVTQETKLVENVFKDIFESAWKANSGKELKSQMADPTKAPNLAWQCQDIGTGAAPTNR